MADFKLTFGNGEDFTLKKGEIKKGIEKTWSIKYNVFSENRKTVGNMSIEK